VLFWRQEKAIACYSNEWTGPVSVKPGLVHRSMWDMQEASNLVWMSGIDAQRKAVLQYGKSAQAEILNTGQV